ncbi:unnamed protein product [Mycena citricolor]|uniref:Uncharacterized protein n=1 Tax=Mycena citricolor TaxID=2018698 RepID=A0AAD2H5C5_9AGAR|nr:unnamed protein product [Mycena citricolor]
MKTFSVAGKNPASIATSLRCTSASTVGSLDRVENTIRKTSQPMAESTSDKCAGSKMSAGCGRDVLQGLFTRSGSPDASSRAETSQIASVLSKRPASRPLRTRVSHCASTTRIMATLSATPCSASAGTAPSLWWLEYAKPSTTNRTGRGLPRCSSCGASRPREGTARIGKCPARKSALSRFHVYCRDTAVRNVAPSPGSMSSSGSPLEARMGARIHRCKHDRRVSVASHDSSAESLSAVGKMIWPAEYTMRMVAEETFVRRSYLA